MLSTEKRKNLVFTWSVILDMKDWRTHAMAAECDLEEMDFFEELSHLEGLKKELGKKSKANVFYE